MTKLFEQKAVIWKPNVVRRFRTSHGYVHLKDSELMPASKIGIRRVPDHDDLFEVYIIVPPDTFLKLKELGGWHQSYNHGRTLVRRGKGNPLAPRDAGALNVFVEEE